MQWNYSTVDEPVDHFQQQRQKLPNTVKSSESAKHSSSNPSLVSRDFENQLDLQVNWFQWFRKTKSVENNTRVIENYFNPGINLICESEGAKLAREAIVTNNDDLENDLREGKSNQGKTWGM